MSQRKRALRRSYAESSGSDLDDLAESGQRKSPKRSKYFKQEDELSDQSATVLSDDTSSGSHVTTDDLPDENSDDASETSIEGISPILRKKSTPSKTKKVDKARDEEDEGTETFIPKLPALPAGDIQYSNSTIHPNSLAFLRDLRENNERDWFQQRELQYLALKSDFESFVLALGAVVTEIDETIPTLPVKDLIFRIYRDIRFSNDRTPYKTFLAAYYSRSGRKGPWAGYYISLEPGDKTLLACGLWQPPSADLALVRASIDAEGDRWHAVLNEPGFVEFFGGEKGLLKTKDQLKTCPKGYAKDHAELALLRLKSFTVSLTFKDEEVLDPAFMEILTVVITQMVPFVTMLNSIIRPDDDPESE